MTEYFFDFLLLSFIDGLEAFYHRSTQAPTLTTNGVRTKRPSTPKWKILLDSAREALELAEEASAMADRIRTCWESRKRPADEITGSSQQVNDTLENPNEKSEEALRRLSRRYVLLVYCEVKHSLLAA